MELVFGARRSPRERQGTVMERVRARFQDKRGVDLPIAEFFAASTVAGRAQLLAARAVQADERVRRLW
jgi:hypothetical protein